MPDAVSADDLLDEWEDAREETPSLSADEFIEQYDDCLCAAVLDEFLVRARRLESLNFRLHNAQQPNSQVDPKSSLHDLTPGKSPVEGYTLVARLGSGGFGEVWKATAPGGFQVAMKFVPLDSRPGRVEERALEVIRELRHPHLLSVFCSWKVGNLLAIAMELADKTLHDRLHEANAQGFNGISRSELIHYMEDAAQAIDYLNEGRSASGMKLQHRDIKPQNLLLLGGGLKVGDFGLIRMIQSDFTGHSGSMTFAYAAPECFEGKTSSRSDQYSLAVTYYHLQTGSLLFQGSPMEVMDGHRNRTPDLSKLATPEQVVLAKALAKSPKVRWESCSKFIQALQAAEVFKPTPTECLEMVPAEIIRNKKTVDLAKWSDEYTSRFQIEMSSNWHKLKSKLQEGVSKLDYAELAFGSSTFNEKWVKPAIEEWMTEVVQPVIESATTDFANILDNKHTPRWTYDELTGQKSVQGQLGIGHALGPALVAGGAGTAAAAYTAGITTTTTFFVFTSTVILWPVLLAGLAASLVLIAAGLLTMNGISAALQKGFENTVLPPIENAIIGDGIEIYGSKKPSALSQLCEHVKENAAAGQSLIEKGQ